MILVGSGRVFARRYPTAVLWGISAVRINAVYRESVSITVVYSPRFECTVVIPIIAELNALATVELVCRAVGVIASLTHTAPNCVQPGSVVVALAMSGISPADISNFFSVQAAA